MRGVSADRVRHTPCATHRRLAALIVRVAAPDDVQVPALGDVLLALLPPDLDLLLLAPTAEVVRLQSLALVL
jgi:hypothetical protein